MLPFFLTKLLLVAGYGKMPGYEHVFTDFLLSLAKKEYKRRQSYNSLSSGEW
jgi:inositol-1,3,4-trisphosphate 5/6-kinase / inositol-tetrakisphosphate 1-kinase